MTGFLPNNAPRAAPATRKMTFSEDSAMRRNRILPPAQCQDNRAKLTNLRHLISATDREYREMTQELDRLNNEGRVWLVVDLIHKTALASLDLGAAIMQASGLKAGDVARKLADGTQTFSDVYGGAAGVANGTTTKTDFARTLGERALTHVAPKTAGGAMAKGQAGLGLSGWKGIESITGASGADQRSARTIEAAADNLGALVQRSTETIEAATEGGSPVAKRVGASAQIARAMASYNREIEAAFSRRLETSGGLMASKANFQAIMQRTMARYRRDAAQLETLLAGCL